MGKLELLAETTAGHYLLTFHVLRDSHIQGKPPLLSGSDCVRLGLVKIRADDSLGTSRGTAILQKAHPELPVQLPTPENSHARDIISPQNQYQHHGCWTFVIKTHRCILPYQDDSLSR